MPMPKPRDGEDRGAFVSRCMSFLDDEGSAMNQDQRLGACYSQWEKSKKLEKIAEITDPPAMTTEFGPPRVAPEVVVAGHYPEFEEVELPENLKARTSWSDSKI